MGLAMSRGAGPGSPSRRLLKKSLRVWHTRPVEAVCNVRSVADNKLLYFHGYSRSEKFGHGELASFDNHKQTHAAIHQHLDSKGRVPATTVHRYGCLVAASNDGGNSSSCVSGVK